ncbi:hypothetical protein L1987_18777 [Smallanthus sonchifolius]|uniref:Uncharacterized protein n=1 Tax=Smallanthus sonchifolius TaxID=185202 RepID=A0ACB9J186_9ASTR|nr:hypothetical protein L1987_18777 [Smallanthus sonchifolius]
MKCYTPSPKSQKLKASAIRAAQTDVDFVDSLIISPVPSKSPTPQRTPTISRTQDEAGPSTTSDPRDAKITALESQSVLTLRGRKLLVLWIMLFTLHNDDDEPDVGGGSGERQNVDATMTSLTQEESDKVVDADIIIEKETSRVVADMLDNSFLVDSDVDEADRLECLLNLDELVNDEEVDVGNESEIKEGEIVELEVVNDTHKIVYE